MALACRPCERLGRRVDKMGMPKVLGKEDGIDIWKRDAGVWRSKDVCNGPGHGIEQVVKDVSLW